ncbi:MAG: thioredoxin-like domain-containing protein, partial [Rickettsiales bacterium]
HYLEEKFGDKLTVIGVHSAKFANEKDTENIRQAMLRYDIEHPVVNDNHFNIWKSFGVHAWPTFVLINPSGHIEAVYSGEGNREAAEQDIARLIAKAGDRLRTEPLPLDLEKNKQPESLLAFPGKLALAEDFGGKPMLFISDNGHHQIVGARLDGRIELVIGSGEEGLKDGDLAHAQFNHPQGVLWDAKTQTLFVADTDNHALRAIDLKTKTVSTLAGNGKQGRDRVVMGADARRAQLASPWDLAFYPDANHILIAMAGTHQLWVYDREEEAVSVVAGNGRESIDDGRYPMNSLSQPSGLAVKGDVLYFVDSETSSLRRLEDGKIKTLIGTGLFDFGYKEGTLGVALMQHPLGVDADDSGVYIADSYNHAIRKFDPETGKLSDFAGTGERGDVDSVFDQARFNEPNDIVHYAGTFYVADTNNHRIRTLDEVSGKVGTLELRLPEFALQPPEYDASLPELASLPHQEVVNRAAIQLHLKTGWKINADAPTYLALYEVEDHTPLAQWNREALKAGSAKLP